jgi:hypothetical protein
MEVVAPAVASQHTARRRARILIETVVVAATFHFEVAGANP